MGALKYAVIGVVVIVVISIALVSLLPTLYRAPMQYVGSPSGYEAFVPNGQTMNYNGQTDPTINFTIGNDTARIVGVSPGNSPGFINIISFIVFFLIISYIIIRRLRPRKFKASRLYKWTAIYVLLTLFLAVQISDPLLLLILPASGIIGYILGLKILERNEIKFFYKDDVLYYKWPTPIIVLWSGLFVIRLFLELLGSENIIVLSIVDLLLSFSTGLIVSASIITVRQAKQFFK